MAQREALVNAKTVYSSGEGWKSSRVLCFLGKPHTRSAAGSGNKRGAISGAAPQVPRASRGLFPSTSSRQASSELRSRPLLSAPPTPRRGHVPLHS